MMREHYDEYKDMINEYLLDYIPGVDTKSSVLYDAMKYSLTAGGKRLRSVLLLAACEFAGGDAKDALPYACAIEYIHSQLVAERDRGKAILLVSLELDEVMSLSDRILVLYEGEIVGELDPKKTNIQELGLYMAGAKRMKKEGEGA